MKKSIKLFITLLLTTFIISCSSMDKVLVLNSSVGTNLFLRNIEINLKNDQVKHLEFDVTVNVSKGELSYNPIVNYTLTTNKKVSNESDKIIFYFENNGKRFSVIKPELMFRSFKGKNKINTRYTSEIDMKDFNEILSNYEQVNVVLVLPDTSEILISDKRIDQKFNDLRVLAK